MEAPEQPGESPYENLEASPGDGFAGAPEADDATGPPDVGEALQQMNQRLEEFGQRLPADEYDDDGADWDSEEFAYNPAIGEQNGADDDTAELRQLLSEAVQEQVQPYIEHQEEMQREQQLLQLADQYPRLREPEVLDAVAAEADRMAEAYGNPAMATDPRLILNLYRSFEAMEAANGTPAEQPQGARLETGAGPGQPQAEVDPVQQAWLNAAMPTAAKSVFDR